MKVYTKIQTDITDLLFVYEGLVMSTSNYSFDLAHNLVNCVEMSM